MIDADALMDVINMFPITVLQYTIFKRYVDRAIMDAPTVGEWVSVKDRLPEEHADEHPYEFEQYLCATVWNDVLMVGFGTRMGDDKQHFWSGSSIWDDWVTHWMPLPEPYKKEGD